MTSHKCEAVDICSLLLVLSLLYRAYISHRWSYEEVSETASDLLGIFFCGDFLELFLGKRRGQKTVRRKRYDGFVGKSFHKISELAW